MLDVVILWTLFWLATAFVLYWLMLRFYGYDPDTAEVSLPHHWWVIITLLWPLTLVALMGLLGWSGYHHIRIWVGATRA